MCGRRLPALLGALLALLVLAPAARAQVQIQLIDTVPPGQTITNLGQFTLQYEVTGTANGVEVNFFRDDGDLTVVAIPDPNNPPPPFQVTLPLRTNVDRDPNMFNAVVRDLVTNEIDLDGPFTILADDVGPEMPVVTSPAFPATVFFPTVTIQGTVRNGMAGPPTMPETSGSIVVQRTDNMTVIGGGAITSSSNFVAIADLSSLVLGTPTDIDIFAVDAAGNAGTTLTVQVTRLQAAAPMVVASLDPPSGTITRNPGVAISGSITGDVEPLTVNIFVDGLLESQVTGLSDGEQFIHTINLPGEGPHTISIQGENGLQPPTQGTQTVLGTITLDRTPPRPPQILDPNPTQGPLFTNASTFTIEGLSQERDTVPTDAFAPAILLQAPPGVSFDPAPPLSIDTATSRFMTEADISMLEDGDYFVDVIARDEAGNIGPESTTRIAFTVDRTPPQVDRIRVDGILAPSADPEIYVGQVAVPIEVTFSEPVPVPPDLFLTQEGGNQVPVGRSGQTTRVITYTHGVVPGFDGPVQVDLSGGADRAGNSVMATFMRLFIVDTVPPEVVSVDPSDGTTVNVSPERVRVRMEDPPSSTGTFAGVDLIDSTITLFGPVGSAGQTIAGTQTPFDPFTLDFVPTDPLPADGTYRVTIVPEDRVGNRAIAVVRTFIFDTTPLALNDNNVIVNPPRGACVGAETIPGTAASPFVDVTVTDPMFDPVASELVVRDFCRVPPEVPGRKEVVDADTIRYVFDEPLATDGSQDGVYAVQLDARDIAGNVSPTFTTTYVFDTTSPSVRATFPATGSSVNGPLRIVDATFLDPRRDFCRPAGGISKTTSTLSLTLVDPNPLTNLNPPDTPIRGVLRFESVGSVERVLLEIVDAQNRPTGLRNDGGDDGVYRLDTQAVDCGGNRSPLVTGSFVYDTIRPQMEVDGVMEGGSITGPDFTMTGRLVDNRNGSGVDRVTVTLEAVDALGNVTTAPFFLDAPAELDPVALEAQNPVVEWTFVGDLRRVPKNTRARLRVRGFDEAGNFDERIFTVRAMADALPPPIQAAPASGAATSAQLLEFSWEPFGDAKRFRVRIVTPNGDVVERETEDNRTSLVVNLTALPDPEGRFTWAVASVDDVGGVGPFSPNRPFFVDRRRPRVVAIDVVDPSPEAVGSVNEGLVRLTLHFNEDMDTTIPPRVVVQPQNPEAPPLVVQQLSYEGDLWQGEVRIPEPVDASVPDPNGIAEVRVTGAFDPGGNENEPPLGGIALFEIDTGPFFRVGVFKNPVDEEDVILLVKGFRRDQGVAEEIVAPPSVRVTRTGQPEQVPVLHRINDSTFRGVFRLDADTTQDVRIFVSGTDVQGNTSTRQIDLTVERPFTGEPIRIQTMGLRVDLEADAAPPGRSLTALSLAHALTAEEPGTEELEAVAPVAQVGPLGTRLSRPARVVVAPSELPDDLRGVGLFRRDGEELVFLGARASGEGLEGRTSRLGPMLLMRDRTPPRLGDPELRWERGALRVEVSVEERGAGVDPAALRVRVGDASFPASWDPERGVVVARIQDREVREGDAVTAEGADGVGNVGTSSAALVPRPRYGISEAVAYPNPARRFSRIRYDLNQPVDRVRVRIYDAAGRKVRDLAGGAGAGVQDVTWDLRDRRGRTVANGVYLAAVTAEGPGGRIRERIKIAVLR